MVVSRSEVSQLVRVSSELQSSNVSMYSALVKQLRNGSFGWLERSGSGEVPDSERSDIGAYDKKSSPFSNFSNLEG